MSRARELPVVGWREWVALPGLQVAWVKAKVDTGARSSSLHVEQVEEFRKGGRRWVRFVVHPLQRDTKVAVAAEAHLIEMRKVRSSSGEESVRPVIETDVKLMGRTFPIEVTLASRDEMGFRMLLGRQALRKRFVVDPGRSFVGGRGPDGARRRPGPHKKKDREDR